MVSSSKFKVQRPRSKVPGPKVQGSKSKVQGPTSNVQSPTSKVRVLSPGPSARVSELPNMNSQAVSIGNRKSKIGNWLTRTSAPPLDRPSSLDGQGYSRPAWRRLPIPARQQQTSASPSGSLRKEDSRGIGSLQKLQPRQPPIPSR